MTIQEITQAALSLPIDMRLSLVDDLNHSLHMIDDQIEQAWIKEAENRMSQLQASTAETIDGDVVFKQIFARYAS
jgi:hypothetical protein